MKTAITLFALLTVGQLQAQTEVKPHMQNFYLSAKQVSSYLVDKKEYVSEKNDKEIAQALTDFNQKIIKLKQENYSKTDDMKFRVKLLEDGLFEAEQSFKNGSKDYSFWVLKSTLNNCYACHTQKGLSATTYKFDLDKKYDGYSQADFLFLVRNYTESTEMFEKVILNYPENNISIENLENSIQRLLYYNVRVLKDDQKTLALFDRLSKNQKLPSSVRNDFLAWKKYLNVKKYRLAEEGQIKNAEDLEDFVLDRNQIAAHYKLSNQRYVVDLETSTFLYQLLENKKMTKLKPWILYWLAFQEKDYRLSMFDMSVDSYLKECIERYTKHPAAKKCFELYKELTIDSFTGSRGVDVPATVSDQLKKYENMVNKKK